MVRRAGPSAGGGLARRGRLAATYSGTMCPLPWKVT